ncbi:membrane-associated phospholipid phosphatase [Massilia niabensis]|uniref:Membrane-associated phospholipid phosphatase n=1 Tax=Massilia niabensis TaxID=544910 RepID=A0ABW0L0N8_9BURK
MSWTTFLYLGNLTLTLPLASAIAAWLLAARHWRAAGYWLLFFSGALALVGISKVAYLGWGIAIPALDFQALSGHAAGVTAVFPVLFYVLLQGRPGLALGAAAAGLLLGAGLASALVATEEHTAAEAGAGWMVGAAAAAGTVRVAKEAQPPRPLAGLAAGLLAFAATAWVMQGAHIGYWMIKLALALSGNTRPFQWGCCN